MKDIKMVDLNGQYLAIKEEVDTAISHVVSNAAFINGPEVHQFQEDLETYLQVKHVIPCANGTDALQIALMALGLKPGDEVITPDFTFAATVEVIALLNLTPILVDVDKETFTIDIAHLERSITSKTKAIIPVHLFGQCAQMEAINEIAKKHGLAVIEDTAQAIGATYTFKDNTTKKAGTIGTIGTTSFFPSKNLGCYGDGGALFTNDEKLAHTIRGIVNHGMYKRYYHDVVGVNSRLDSIQAAVLRIKLKRLDQYNNARIQAANRYHQNLGGFEKILVPQIGKYTNHVFHQYTIKLIDVDRDKLHEHLLEKGIPNAIYYPVPLHKQKAYQSDRFKEEDYPITNHLSETVLSLPMHTELTDEQIDYMTRTIIDFSS